MIDKLEVGVKYKLINKDDYLASSHGNRGYLCNYLTECGCLVLDYIDKDGDGLISGDVVIGMGIGEGEFFAEYNEDVDTEVCMEYRVIRKASKHQVCDWRKGVRLYEDEFGTLVRNDKRTKFYTDIVEWREVVEPVSIKSDNVDTFSKEDVLGLILRIQNLEAAVSSMMAMEG